MSSRLERALHFLTNSKSSASLRKDAAERISEIILDHPENSHDVLLKIGQLLTDSRNNECRIYSALVLKSVAEKCSVEGLGLSWAELEVGRQCGRDHVLVEGVGRVNVGGGCVNVNEFLAAHEVLPSKTISNADHLLNTSRTIEDVIDSTNCHPELPSNLSSAISSLQNLSEFSTEDANEENDDTFSCQLATPSYWVEFCLPNTQTSNVDAVQEYRFTEFTVPVLKVAVSFLNKLASFHWETRHGAALGIKYLLVPCLKTNRAKLSSVDGEKCMLAFLDHVLKVFLLDNFSDFVTKDTSFPVREILAEVIADIFIIHVEVDLSGLLFGLILQLIKSDCWRLKIDGLLILNCLGSQKVNSPDQKWVTFFEEVLETVVESGDRDEDIVRLTNQFMLILFDSFRSEAKKTVTAYLVRMLTSCTDKADKVKFETIQPNTLKLLQKCVQDLKRSACFHDLKTTRSIKANCWTRLFSYATLSSEKMEFCREVENCLKTVQNLNPSISDCYLSALVCFTGADFSDSLESETKKLINVILANELNPEQLESVGKICQELLGYLVLRSNEKIIFDCNLLEYNLELKLEVLREMDDLDNPRRDCLMWVVSKLIAYQKDFLSIVKCFLTSSKSYVNLKVGLFSILNNDMSIFNKEKELVFIIRALNQILVGDKFCFEEQIAILASVRSKLSKFQDPSIELKSGFKFEDVEKFLKTTKTADRDNSFRSEIETQISEFKSIGDCYWANIRSLCACACTKLSSFPDKVSFVINPLLNVVKTGSSPLYVNLAKNYLLKICENPAKMSGKALEKIVDNLLCFLSNADFDKLELLFAKNTQIIPIAEELWSMFSSANSQNLQAVCFILNSQCLQKLMQSSLAQKCQSLNNGIKVSDEVQKISKCLLCFCNIFRHCDSELPTEIVGTMMECVKLFDFENCRRQMKMLSSLLIANGLINSVSERTVSEFFFRNFLVGWDSLSNDKQTFAMTVILMFSTCKVKIESPAHANPESHLLVCMLNPVLKSISSAEDEVRSMASRIFGLILPHAVSFVDDTRIKSRKFNSSIVNEFLTTSVDFTSRLLNNQAFTKPSIPDSIKATLRDYQKDGVAWLQFLRNYNLGGILADDLGLGKTLMCICVLAEQHEQVSIENFNESSRSKKISLIVCPKSLIHHWRNEIDTFCPELAVKCVDDKKLFASALQFDVKYGIVITSYELVRSCVENFEAFRFDYVILDEGHVVKNANSKLFCSVRKLKAQHRLVLTGTPIQNNICEIWTLFEFLMPSYLGSIEHFKKYFANQVKNSSIISKSSVAMLENENKALKQLHAKVLPLILRREKESVLKELPPKSIQDILCSMRDRQKELYEEIEDKYAKLTDQKSSAFKLIRVLLQVCNYPKLLSPKYNFESAKLEALKDLLSSIFLVDSEQKHRLLLFFQTKAMMKVVCEQVFQSEDFTFLKHVSLNGSLSAHERMQVVNKFNSDPTVDILMSTTAVGGVGLNLTGADTVVFMEHDFNPVKDLQAMDRAHRLGQKRAVTVYRLVTADSVEERIMSVQKWKRAVAECVINEQNSSTQHMHTYSIADTFATPLKQLPVDDDDDEERADEELEGRGCKRRKKRDLNSVLEELEHLWTPLSKLDDLI